MKKLIARMRKVRITRWNKLTLGEKMMKIVMKLVKVAVIIAIVVAAASVVAAVVGGLLVGFAIISAVAGGFSHASRAYIPGDRYIRFL